MKKLFDVVQRGDVAVLQMVHGKANTLDTEFCQGLTEQLHEFKSSSAKAIVLTGQENIFSAGVDLKRLLDGGRDYLKEFLPALASAFDNLFFYPKPIVAAVNGHAIAGGCVIACAADYRFMAEGNGRMGVPELIVGVPFPTIALEIMRLAVNSGNLQSLMYGGATHKTDAVVDLGLIDELVEPSDLLDHAVGHAEKLPEPLAGERY